MFRDIAPLLELRPDDLILTGDADEIPSGVAVQQAANYLRNQMRPGWEQADALPYIVLDLEFYTYSLFHFTVSAGRNGVPFVLCRLLPKASVHLQRWQKTLKNAGSATNKPSGPLHWRN